MSKEILRTNTSLQSSQLDYILIDGSSSMMDKWYDTIGAVSIFIEALRSENINSHGIIHSFCSRDLEFIQRDGAIGSWESLKSSPLKTNNGMTPLFDAIQLLGRRIAELDPPSASIVIATDGEDTSSQYTNVNEARAILDWLRAKGYQITFIGADFNNSKQAALLGATPQNSLAVQRKKLLEAGAALAKKRIEHIRSGKPINFTEDEKTDFGGYLSPPRS